MFCLAEWNSSPVRVMTAFCDQVPSERTREKKGTEQMLPQDDFPFPESCLQKSQFSHKKKAENYLDLSLCTSLELVFSIFPSTEPLNFILHHSPPLSHTPLPHSHPRPGRCLESTRAKVLYLEKHKRKSTLLTFQKITPLVV